MRQRSGSPKASRPTFCSNYAWLLSPTAAHLHHLWHTYASRALALGESLTMIGKLLGHTQVQTTARYAHLARDSIQNAAARITGSIGGNLSSVQDVDETSRH